ncbi:keratin-associated protein family, partial [Trichomonas vaginalis G3]|uniref:keratin-associated protein family n=1 Tax=Trichomonas vaginalis (strain ATCC PRA-98 / G3) TaxID=412133 RepID=UPI0021E571AA
MFDGLAYNPRLGIIEPINLHPLMAARDLDEGGQVVQTIVENLLNIYPEFKEVLTATNTTIRENCIVFNTEDNILDYMFVVLGQLAKTIKEKGIDSVITVEDVMLRKTFDSLFQEPKEVVSLYEVLNAMLTKINESDTGNISEAKVVELLSQKADKNHVHYISSDEQIITDYHGYLTQDEEVKTKEVNERRYKFIRAKGYDIYCTVQYDTGKAQEAFGYNDEIHASYFFVNDVLVEPRFTLRVKAKITFEDAIKSKADKDELDATNKVLKSHKHNISDINELQATLNSKADKNHTHESFTTVRADDIILNYTLGSSAPLENPSTSVKDTLNNLDNSCRNIEDHARNFEAYELPTMLDKKADKTELQTLKTEILQTLYPIGSIYTSMNSTNPETVLGFGT